MKRSVISRRRALAAAAWSTPAVLAASAAPAYATSTSTRSRYQIDWATSGYTPAASPETAVAVVAQRISGTAGPSTLGLSVLATEYRMGGSQRWLPFGGDDMRISGIDLVAGRPGLVMSSRASTNVAVTTGAESLDRTLVLTPIGFTMRALNVEVGAMSRDCNGHNDDPWSPGYNNPTTGTHSTVDALRFFVGADVYRGPLAMDEPAGRLEKFVTSTSTTFITPGSTPAASFISVDRESALSNWGSSTVQIGHHNHCAGLLYPSDGNSWTPWVATRTVFGPISFDVEFGTV